MAGDFILLRVGDFPAGHFSMAQSPGEVVETAAAVVVAA